MSQVMLRVVGFSRVGSIAMGGQGKRLITGDGREMEFSEHAAVGHPFPLLLLGKYNNNKLGDSQ